MNNYYIYNGVLYDSSSLSHHGVKGMKWGVRKSRRMLSKLNRANTRMEKHHSVQTSMKKHITTGKNSKNPLVKIYGASFILDHKLASARYSKAKKKVDGILNEFDQQGITLKTLEERKSGLSVGGMYDSISNWVGVRYKLDD